MAQDDGAASDTDGQGRQLCTAVAQFTDDRQNRADGGQTGYRCGTTDDAYGGSQNETGNSDGQTRTNQRVPQRRTHAGIHQNLLKDAAGTGDQKNNTGGLDGSGADVHHFLFAHAAADGGP